MTDSQSATAPAMSAPAEDQLADYQSFNIFALAGFVFGLASVASLLDRLFWLIPAAGVGMSFYALWTISRGNRAQVGRPLAVVGLCLSLFFLVAAPTSALIEKYYIRSEARAFSDRWFEYLKHGDAVAAYDMTLNYSSRAFRDDLSDRTMHAEGVAMWDYYNRNRWPKTLLDNRHEFAVEYVDTPVQIFQNGRYLVRHRYRIRQSDEDNFEDFGLTIERDKDHSTGQWHWRVSHLIREDEAK
ncbi:MAG: hypothetical protein MI757_04245 [Pirellulales bacterium]|nr:hypothetical protein [Pirellulales bacterium]